jgi:glutathione S-transferase
LSRSRQSKPGWNSAAATSTCWTHLATQDYLLAGGLSLADLSASAYRWWAADAGIDLQAWPQVDAWLARIAAQPGWQHPDALMAPEN